MVNVDRLITAHVAFSHRGKNWTHSWELAAGSTVLQLKERMVAPTGAKEDVDSIELQQRGTRVPDWEVIEADTTLDFHLLRTDEGTLCAREDAAQRGHRGADRQKLTPLSAEDAPDQARKPAAPSEPVRPSSSAAAPAAGSQQLAASASQRPAASGSEWQACQWQVIGGKEAGGIIVRTGKELGSPKAPERLSWGSTVLQQQLLGERLYYKLIRGSGPSEGWVSLRITGKELLQPL